MFFSAPEAAFPKASFWDEAVYVGVPFQVPAESVQHTDKARRKEFFFIILMEKAQDNTPDSSKETV